MRRLAGLDLVQAAERYQERLAIVDGEMRLTYTEVHRRSNALANGLRALGCRPGERIAVWLPNGQAAVETFLGLEKGGYIRIPIDVAENTDFVRRIVDTYRPGGLVADGKLLSRLEGAYWPECTLAAGPGSVPGARRLESVVEGGDVGVAGVEVDDEGPYQVYVRMVAGDEAMAVQHTHRNWRQECLRNQVLYLGGWYGPALQDDEVFLNVQQLMHGTGIMGFYPLHILGCPVVMLPRFDPEATVAAIEQHRVTTTFMVPGMVERIRNVADSGRYRVGSLRRILYGGAPISPTSLSRCIDTLGDVLVQLYGRFEGGWPITLLDQRDHRRMREGHEELWGSCGRLAPFVEVAVVDRDGRPVEPGAPGEIVVRGDGVVPEAAGADGWCHTTDLAIEGPPGYLRLVGRTDDMINSGGYHIYPREVERILSSHPAVAEVCVLGRADPKWGEAVTAFVVLGQGFDPGPDLEESLTHHCQRSLPSYKVPKRFVFVDPAEADRRGGLRRDWL